MVNAKNDRYLSQWKYLSFFGIACCIGLYIIVVEKLLYEYRPKSRAFMLEPDYSGTPALKRFLDSRLCLGNYRLVIIV